MTGPGLALPNLAGRIRLATRVLALVMAIATAGLVIGMADMTAGTSLFMLLVLGWCVSPYAAIALALHRPWLGTEAVLVALATTIAVAGLAAYIYIVAFFVKPDPQGGLVLLFIPLWQWVGVVLGLGGAWLVERRPAPPGGSAQ